MAAGLSVLWTGLTSQVQQAAQQVEDAAQQSADQQVAQLRETLAADVLQAGTAGSAALAAQIAPPHPAQVWARQHAAQLAVAGALVVVVVLLLMRRRRR